MTAEGIYECEDTEALRPESRITPRGFHLVPLQRSCGTVYPNGLEIHLMVTNRTLACQTDAVSP